ncbi:uncharacterized protein LOC128549498 [Mercenaria mercenaria]|uniref:uncharacterized protein LOC128549498 n=1 Tax=Mercenaria mercenaria TaxID=6596 RepID=UPI00234E68F5|nr:uncharacterized protein LOC128549498 [Mercenaria mercenaria]
MKRVKSEKYGFSAYQPRNEINRKRFSGPSYSSQSSASALVSTSDKQRITQKKCEIAKKCRFYQENHWSDECPLYKTIHERKSRIQNCCFKWLKSGHSFTDCKTNKVCVYCGKANVHHCSLCPTRFSVRPTMTNTVNEITTQQEETEPEKGLMSVNEIVLMQTVLTEVKNPETLDTMQVRILFDSGSHRSYISESLAKKMNLKTDGEHDIHVATFGNKDTRRITTKYTKLNVKLKNGTEMQITTDVVPLISGELQRRPIKDLESEKVQDIVNSVQLADTLPTQNEKNTIDVLIGNDYYLDFIHSEKIEVQKGLYLLASKLGWIISGRINDPECSNDEASILGFITIDTSCRTKIAMEDFWNMESIEIVDKQTKEDDVIAMEKFRVTIEFKDDRYFVSWPWKEDEPELPINKELANGRLKSTVNRLKKTNPIF